MRLGNWSRRSWNSQKKIKSHHQAEKRDYCPGDQVLVLLPVVESPFQAKFFGLCSVSQHLSEQN